VDTWRSEGVKAKVPGVAWYTNMDMKITHSALFTLAVKLALIRLLFCFQFALLFDGRGSFSNVPQRSGCLKPFEPKGRYKAAVSKQ
jgi:hypothetical protein